MLRGAFIVGAIAVGIAGAPLVHASPSTTTTSPAPTTGSTVYYPNWAMASPAKSATDLVTHR